MPREIGTKKSIQLSHETSKIPRASQQAKSEIEIEIHQLGEGQRSIRHRQRTAEGREQRSGKLVSRSREAAGKCSIEQAFSSVTSVTAFSHLR